MSETLYPRIRVQTAPAVPRIRLRVLPSLLPLNVSMQNTGVEVQWRIGDGPWQDLISVDDINASVEVGAVTTLAAGSPATVTNVGTEQDVVLNFGIPVGFDGQVQSVNGKTGDVILAAGDIGVTPAGGISSTDAQSALAELDSEKAPKASPVFTGTVTLASDPVSALQATTKQYVDNAIAGWAWKASVRAAATANGTLASAFANGQVIDGVTLATGDRILLKNQTTGADNGIYTVNASGAPTRATDADTGAELKQAAVFVQEGTANADTAWVCTNNGTITVGTTALIFVQFGPGQIYTFDGLAPTTTRGDLIARGASSNGRLALGASGYHVQSNGSDPVWAGFLQSGTGAVIRTWNAKAADFVSVKDFGATGNGTTDDTTAVQAAYTYAGTIGCTVRWPAGTYKLTANINVPVGTFAVDTVGDGWQNTIAAFSGSSVTKGFYFDGTSYSRSGSISDMKIVGASGAIHGVYFEDLNHPLCNRVEFTGFNGAAIFYDSTLNGVFSNCLVSSCGTSTEGQVVVDNIAGAGSTTWRWDQSRISGGSSALCGLMIDDTDQTTIVGGSIESTQTPIVFSSKTGRTHGVRVGIILGVDLENPGTGNPFLDFGSGWTTGAAVYEFTIDACNGSQSGTTSNPKAVKLANCTGVDFGQNNWGQAGTPTCTYSLEGTNNRGITIVPSRGLWGQTWPWVLVNGVQRKDATPRAPFNTEQVSGGIVGGVIAGTAGTIMTTPVQGGYYANPQVFNASATTMSTLTDGQDGEAITMTSTNGNTTIAHSPGTTDGFSILSGSNLVMVASQPYQFIRYSGVWRQF